MGKGSESYATPLAPWVEGAHRRLIREGEKEAYGQGYVPYQAERLAEFTPEEQAAFAARQALFDEGDPWGAWSGDQLKYASGLPGQLGDITSDYSAQQFGSFDPSTFGEFDQAAADRYMSPYIQSVLESEKSAARDQFARSDMRSDSERVASGARGGYREALQGFLGDSEKARAMADIQSKGMQSAYQSAQQQFERDRAAAIQAAKMGDASAYNAAQMSMKANLANQQRVMTSAELASKFAAMGQDFGSVNQARELERIKSMELSGATQRERDQQQLTMDAQDWEAQLNYPWTQLSRMQALISGTPAQVGGYQQMQPPASIASQLLGLGLGYQGIQDLLS